MIRLVRMATTPLDGGLVRVAMCVHNTTPVADGLDRAGARCGRRCARRTLVVRAPGGRFVSPIAPGPSRRRRWWRVRARQHLPGPGHRRRRRRRSARRSSCPTTRRSRPRAAATCSTRPRSRRRCCCTCSRSATPSARRSRRSDPTVREMLARADAGGPSIRRLHGRVTVTDPAPARPGQDGRRRGGDHRSTASRSGAVTRCACGRARPPRAAGPPAGRAHRHDRADLRRLRGRRAPARVTVDDDPGQELMRDIGRYLYFKPAEVEVVPA